MDLETRQEDEHPALSITESCSSAVVTHGMLDTAIRVIKRTSLLRSENSHLA